MVDPRSLPRRGTVRTIVVGKTLIKSLSRIHQDILLPSLVMIVDLEVIHEDSPDLRLRSHSLSISSASPAA